MSVRLSICLSICTALLSYHWTDFCGILYMSIFVKSLIKFRFHENLRRMAVLYVKTCIHLWYCLAQFFLEWKMFQTKVVEKIRTHISWSVAFLRKSYRLWDNVEKYGVQPGRSQMTVWRMRIACLIRKARNTHLEYLMVIPFALQQLVRACLVKILLYTRSHHSVRSVSVSWCWPSNQTMLSLPSRTKLISVHQHCPTYSTTTTAGHTTYLAKNNSAFCSGYNLFPSYDKLYFIIQRIGARGERSG